VELPKDTDILGRLHVVAGAAREDELVEEDKEEEQEEEQERVPCLRETKAHCFWSLVLVLCEDHLVVQWGLQEEEEHKLALHLHDVTNTLKAFTVVLLYANGYALWKKETCDFEADSSIQKVAKRRWTDDSRGTGKMNGWPPEVHTPLYKNMVRRIGTQKEMPALREFEKDLLARFQSDGKSQPRGGARQPDGDDANMEGIMELSDDEEDEE
jgi:hypothetical protein